MQHGVAAAHEFRQFCVRQPGARNRRSRHAHPEHRTGDMFRGVHRPLLAQDLLRARNFVGIQETVAMMREAGAHAARWTPWSAPCSACRRAGSEHPAGASAAMRRPAGQNALDVGIPFKHLAETILHHHRHAANPGDAPSAAPTPAWSERSRPANANGSPRSRRSRRGRPTARQKGWHLLFDARFIHQHDRNIVANGIHALAFDALQAVLILLELHRRLAQRAHQDLQQFLTDGHRYRPV